MEESMTKKKIAVAFDPSTVGEIRYIRGVEKKKDEYDIVYLHERLCAGDISNPPFSNLDNYLLDCGCIENSALEAIETRDEIRKIENYSPDTEIDIYVNVTDRNANELCCYYYFSHVFERFESVNLVKYTDDLEEDDVTIYFPIKVKEKVKLSKDDLKQNTDKWEEIKKQNKGLIIKQNGELVCESYDEVKKIILSVLRGRYRKYGGVFGRFMNAQPIEDKYEHEHFKFCLALLVQEKRVKNSCIHGLYREENASGNATYGSGYDIVRVGNKRKKLYHIYNQKFKLKTRRKPKGKKKKSL